MRKIPMPSGSRPQKDSTECESYEGVQTFMYMAENNLKEVQFERGNLLGLSSRRTTLTVPTFRLSAITAVVE